VSLAACSGLLGALGLTLPATQTSPLQEWQSGVTQGRQPLLLSHGVRPCCAFKHHT
jgi:hypothetical protein